MICFFYCELIFAKSLLHFHVNICSKYNINFVFQNISIFLFLADQTKYKSLTNVKLSINLHERCFFPESCSQS